MFLPNNQEKLQTISEIVREDIGRHIEAGGKYYDDTSQQIAGFAIQSCMPELAAMQQTRVIVEAGSGIAVDDEERIAEHLGIAVQAKLQKVTIKEVIQIIRNTEPPISFASHDLFAVLAPQYIDPEPKELVFGQEIYVPFRDIEKFESAA